MCAVIPAKAGIQLKKQTRVAGQNYAARYAETSLMTGFPLSRE